MLPQYSKQYKPDDIEGDEANEPFLNASHRASTETAPPTYPPGLPATQTGRSNVQYRYEPVYPRKGPTKAAVGVMGRTKQVSRPASMPSSNWLNAKETIEIVQRGFPELAEFDQDRISFKNGANAVIFDEAWEHFGQHPPEMLQILVEDAPGEKYRRRLTPHRPVLILSR
jgi:hypothetical protein